MAVVYLTVSQIGEHEYSFEIEVDENGRLNLPFQGVILLVQLEK